MIRVAIELILLFLLPTVAYFGYALLARPDASPRAVVNKAPYVGLSLAGAVLVGATLIYYGWTASDGGTEQTYTPAKIKDGQLEPGSFK